MGIVIRFNSKLVRLKVPVAVVRPAFFLWFQFQTGAIKRCEGLLRRDLQIPGFNSKLVRLKGDCPTELKVTPVFQFQTGAIKSRSPQPFAFHQIYVSIPNWCD